MSAIGIALVILATLGIGSWTIRFARTSADVLVASRSIHPALNASAVCGEYLSAGTFLGLAGLVMVYGVDMLWYPVGFTAGYLALLAVVAPMRRFGSYTIGDFIAGRLNTPALRGLTTVFVLVIGWMYLLPQTKGAGVTLRVLLGTPYWFGVVLVGVVVILVVVFGGMRGVTFVQAFHFWVKLIAIALPLLVIASVATLLWPQDGLARMRQPTTITLSQRTEFVVDEPTTVTVTGGQVDGKTGSLQLQPGVHQTSADTTLVFERGSAAPRRMNMPVSDGTSWRRPFGVKGDGRTHPLYVALSLIVATVFGTMGLPHIIARFYTNPDGRLARKTTVIVLALLSVYYLFPPLYGALGRTYAPDLYLTGATETVVLVLPARLVPGLVGRLLGALVAAGAFAAFISSSSGLLVSVASALSHDRRRGRVQSFRWAAVIGGVVAIAQGLLAEPFEINVLVGWAFAIAAAAFSPVLILAVWWRRLTGAGAAAAMCVGGGLASASIGYAMAHRNLAGWTDALCSHPALWAVPIALATAVVVSLATPSQVPADITTKMVVMHTPESLRLALPRTGRSSPSSSPAVSPSDTREDEDRIQTAGARSESFSPLSTSKRIPASLRQARPKRA
jgi:cation/acetate symporter